MDTTLTPQEQAERIVRETTRVYKARDRNWRVTEDPKALTTAITKALEGASRPTIDMGEPTVSSYLVLDMLEARALAWETAERAERDYSRLLSKARCLANDFNTACIRSEKAQRDLAAEREARQRAQDCDADRHRELDRAQAKVERLKGEVNHSLCCDTLRNLASDLRTRAETAERERAGANAQFKAFLSLKRDCGVLEGQSFKAYVMELRREASTLRTENTALREAAQRLVKQSDATEPIHWYAVLPFHVYELRQLLTTPTPSASEGNGKDAGVKNSQANSLLIFDLLGIAGRKRLLAEEDITEVSDASLPDVLAKYSNVQLAIWGRVEANDLQRQLCEVRESLSLKELAYEGSEQQRFVAEGQLAKARERITGLRRELSTTDLEWLRFESRVNEAESLVRRLFYATRYRTHRYLNHEHSWAVNCHEERDGCPLCIELSTASTYLREEVK